MGEQRIYLLQPRMIIPLTISGAERRTVLFVGEHIEGGEHAFALREEVVAALYTARNTHNAIPAQRTSPLYMLGDMWGIDPDEDQEVPTSSNTKHAMQLVAEEAEVYDFQFGGVQVEVIDQGTDDQVAMITIGCGMQGGDDSGDVHCFAMGEEAIDSIWKCLVHEFVFIDPESRFAPLLEED